MLSATLGFDQGAMMKRIATTLLWASIVACGAFSHADDSDYLNAIRTQSEKKISAATNRLFGTVEDDDLVGLVIHSNDSVAIAAAWERMKRAFYFRSIMLDYRQELRAEVSRFAGHIEARLRVPIPEIWSDRLNRIAFRSNFSEVDPIDVDEKLQVTWSNSEAVDPAVLQPPASVFSYDADIDLWKSGEIEVRQRNQKRQLYVITANVHVLLKSQQLDNSIHCLNAKVSNDGKLIAAHLAPRPNSPKYGVICWRVLEDGNSDILFSQQRRLIDAKFLVGDHTTHWGAVEFDSNNQRVVVFGIGERVIYVEAFDVVTGKVEMSFRVFN